MQKAQLLYAALNNMNHLVNNQTESIEQASFAANNLSLQMKEASDAARSWTGSIDTSGSMGYWIPRVCLASMAVVVGNWGLPPSVIRNYIAFFGSKSSLFGFFVPT
jgi:hypothetical protein